MSKNNNSYQVAKVRLKWYKIVQVEKQCIYQVTQMINGEWFNCFNCRKETELTFRACFHGGGGAR